MKKDTERKRRMEKLLVTQALDERDLLVKKINDKINKLEVLDTIKANEEKVLTLHLSKEEFENTAAAKGLLIHEWSAADVDADVSRCGKSGSPTNVKQIMSVVLTAGDFKKVEPTEEGVSELIRELIEDHTLG